MGYETSLRVGDRTLLLWRKHASAEPRLLFRFADLQVHERTAIGPEDDEEPDFAISVEYRSTASRVLETLDEAGLGWDATVAAYAATRQDVVATSLLNVRHMMNSEGSVDADEESYLAELHEFGTVAPATDLEALGAVIVDQLGKNSDQIYIFDSITLGGRMDDEGSLAPFDLLRYAEEHLTHLNPYAAVRAFESWIVLNQEAPLLAWPMVLCLMLYRLPPETSVVLDLTEDAAAGGVRTIEEGHEYASEYWTWTSQTLSSTARTMGRLFSVLASFDSKLGADFWFAQSSMLYQRIRSLNNARAVVSSKTRGDALESLTEAIVNTEPELEVIERNVRTREEEIDILIANGLSNPFWQSIGSPLILVECKNTSRPVGVPPLRIFESKIADRGSICKIGIFVSLAGFTSTFLKRLQKFPAESGIIFAVSGEDLRRIVDQKMRLTDWLRGPGIRTSLGRSNDN